LNFASHASAQFWALYDQLPQEIQKRAVNQYELFARDPMHPSLRLKPVGLFWSVRISRTYCALAARRGDSFYWFWIGSHAGYERLLAQL
jgi:hypothetical protein